MKVKIISIPVLNQENALAFYTGKLGFVKKIDVPLSENSRWLTVVSKDEQDGPEILLEPSPDHFEPARVYQKALLDAVSLHTIQRRQRSAGIRPAGECGRSLQREANGNGNSENRCFQ